MKIRNIVIGASCVGAFCLFSAFGGEKMTLQDQLKKVDEVVADNVANFTARKRAECKAMAIQKAIGLAEVKLAAEPKAGATKKVAPAPAKKVTPAKKAPVVTPKPAPAPLPKETTTGRRVDPATNAKETQTTGRNVNPATNAPETQTTGRRKNN